MTAPKLNTRKPTGIVPWPFILIEGGEKLPARFWAKVAVGPAVLDTECWVWTGANSGGKTRSYGVTWDGLRRVKAHRWSWELSRGQRIREDHELDHLCRQTLCVRPSHLEPVPHAVNVARGDAPGPLAVRTNACKRGHRFTPENTIVRGPKHRECRTCHRATTAASKARVRARRQEESI